MTAATRRAFLKTAGGAALAAIGFLYPGITRAAGSGLPNTLQAPTPTGVPVADNVYKMQGSDPSFAGGEVVTKTSDGVILQSAKGMRAVRIPADTVVWKEFDVNLDAIQLHDWVDAKGTPLEDGTLLAKSGWLWINIGRRNGVIEGVSERTIALRHNKGLETIELSSKVEVIQASDGKQLAGGVRALTPGSQIGAVGLRLPGGGFRATRIWQ